MGLLANNDVTPSALFMIRRANDLKNFEPGFSLHKATL
jgi:hypothetical protein